MRKTYSTKEAADLAGISWATLRRWVVEGRIVPSQVIPMGSLEIWRWTEAGVRGVRLYKAKHYREGSGIKKPKPKK